MAMLSDKGSRRIYADRFSGQVLRKYVRGTKGCPEVCYGGCKYVQSLTDFCLRLIFPVARWRLLRNAPSKGHHSRYNTLFFKGTYGVVSFYELMRVSFAGFKHFLR